MDDQVTSQLPGAATSISPTGDGTTAATGAAASGSSRPSAMSPTSSAQWPTKVADTIEDVVAALHDRIVRPLTIVARGLVFGMIIGAMSLVVFVLLAVAVVRLLTVYAFSGRVWASDALVGALFVGVGAFAWSRLNTGGTTKEA
jgi:hypothetical protein